jgi:S-adenosylmethionine-dependent methyltransferase
MTTRSEAFAAATANYLNYIKDPRGQIFYQLVKSQLEPHLPSQSVDVLDIGCAFGLLDLWLAQSGHQVTGLDLTPDYLEIAKQRAVEAQVAIDYRLFNIDEEALSELGQTYQVVICHNVLEYVRDADDAIAQIAQATASGGLLSLVNHNPDSKVLQAAIFEKDPLLALGKLDQTREFINMVQDECRIFTPADLKAKLDAAGFDLIEHYGIRAVYDFVDTPKRSEADYHQQMLELEMAVSARSPFRDIAVFTHLVARKR